MIVTVRRRSGIETAVQLCIERAYHHERLRVVAVAGKVRVGVLVPLQLQSCHIISPATSRQSHRAQLTPDAD